MKQLLFSALTSLVTGIALGLGFLLCLYVSDWLPSKKSSSAMDPISVTDPSDLKILNSVKVANTPYLTIEGQIKNTGPFNWSDLALAVTVKADQAAVNKCSGYVSKPIWANDQQSFSITCDGVVGFNLPSNINYEIKIKSGERWPKEG